MTEEEIKTLERLQGRLAGGDVARYHTRPYLGMQSVADHTWRVMAILQTLWPDCSEKLLLHALYHDVAEGVVGDVPKTAKWEFPDLEIAMKRAEREINCRMKLPVPEQIDLAFSDVKKFQIADMLECVIYCYWQVAAGNLRALDIFNRAINWLDATFKDEEEYVPVLPIVRTLRLNVMNGDLK